MPVVTRPNGKLVVVAGASRSGKTTYVVHKARDARRLLLWDAAGEGARYSCELIRDPAELRARVAVPPKLERLAYQPTNARAEFDFFCQLAWIYIRAARTTLVVEELAGVTHPGKAPGRWWGIISMGLRYGPTIYAVTQRPSEADSSAMGNASRVRCFRMQRASDCKYMANELRVDVAEVERLKPFEWIERDAQGRVTMGAGNRRRRGRPRKTAHAPT